MFDKPGSAQSSEVSCDGNGTRLGETQSKQLLADLLLHWGYLTSLVSKLSKIMIM